MATSPAPVSKKTTTTKSTVAELPASTPKAPPKAAPKARSKATTVIPNEPPTSRTKPAKLTPDASPTKKPRATKKPAAKKSVQPEERYQMIMTAAYYLAERHGFSIGRALDDWIAAEKEIDALLQEKSAEA